MAPFHIALAMGRSPFSAGHTKDDKRWALKFTRFRKAYLAIRMIFGTRCGAPVILGGDSLTEDRCGNFGNQKRNRPGRTLGAMEHRLTQVGAEFAKAKQAGVEV